MSSIILQRDISSTPAFLTSYFSPARVVLSWRSRETTHKQEGKDTYSRDEIELTLYGCCVVDWIDAVGDTHSPCGVLSPRPLLHNWIIMCMRCCYHEVRRCEVEGSHMHDRPVCEAVLLRDQSAQPMRPMR